MAECFKVYISGMPVYIYLYIHMYGQYNIVLSVQTCGFVLKMNGWQVSTELGRGIRQIQEFQFDLNYCTLYCSTCIRAASVLYMSVR